MMIIWRGRGVLVCLITFVICLAANYLADLYGGSGYWDSNNWVFGAALMISGAVIYYISTITTMEERILIDQNTGERIRFVPKHDLFWIPMRYWSYIVAGIGVLVVFHVGRLFDHS
jgi:hypothetical protein